MRVLVLDDESDTREILARVLEDRGHLVATHADPNQARAELARAHFDLAILDWTSAGCLTPAPCPEGRPLPGSRDTLFAAIVSIGDPEEIADALASGADDFLVRRPDAGYLEARVAVMERRAGERAAVQRERDLLSALMEHFPGNVYFKDEESRFLRVNRAMARYCGLADPAAALGKTDHDVFTSEHADQASADEKRIIETGQALTLEERETWPDGRETWVRTSKAPLLDRDGAVRGTFGISMDISEKKRAEQALRASEERYALAMRGANDGIWDWDLASGKVYYSERWKAIVGCDEDEVGPTPEGWLDRVHPEDRARVEAKLADLQEGRAAQFDDEYRLRHKDGGYRWVLARGFALRDASGRPYRMAGAQTDVTDRRGFDPLTGLPNRDLFVERVEAALSRSRRRAGYLFAVLFLDLDRFKVVNDSLGHLLGDRLLMVLGRRLEACLRPEDPVGRFGGDEFAVLLDDVDDATQATRIAERLQAELSQPVDLDGHEVSLSASIGIALSASDYTSPEDLLRDADTAMYRAKALGRARTEVFDEAMRLKVTALLQLESDLRRALDRRELRVHYQPIVDLASGRLLGFEALARWQHAQRGIVGPDEFIPIAEDTGLITSIGDFVLREACLRLKAWHRRFPRRRPLSVSVNCSARQFARADYFDRFARIVEETGLDPRQLNLELTESVILDASENLLAMLADLRSLGVGLHLDDFGTGYSSLSYLHRFPLSSLKIDRSFVSKMDGREENSAIVRSILALAHSRGMRVIAEGMETAEQVALLRVLECDEGQGFYFSPAVGDAAAEAMIEGALRFPLEPPS
jgi:diguanylate cyclase (GGDEF)-like protein/PAS domain S-box-containing protein